MKTATHLSCLLFISIATSILCIEETIHSCGIASFDQRTSKIVGGEEAADGEFPWQVLLQRTDHYDKHLFLPMCGGALLHPRWVITSAHCTTRFFQQKIVLEIGATKLHFSSNLYKVKSIYIHPKYNKITFENDLALLKLEKEIKLTPRVQTICLSESINLERKNVTFTGFGRLIENGPVSKILMKVEVPIISHNLCEDWLEEIKRAQKVEKTFLCAGFKNGGKDACLGDSGSPVQIHTNGRWYLVGAITWGIGKLCGRPKTPTVFIDIRQYAQWIVKQSGNEIHIVN